MIFLRIKNRQAEFLAHALFLFKFQRSPSKHDVDSRRVYVAVGRRVSHQFRGD